MLYGFKDVLYAHLHKIVKLCLKKCKLVPHNDTRTKICVNEQEHGDNMLWLPKPRRGPSPFFYVLHEFAVAVFNNLSVNEL